MKVGFTGTQKGMTLFQKVELAKHLKELGCTEFCHGDCIGADSQAHDIALDCNINLFTIYPPNNPNKRAWRFNRDKVVGKSEYQIIDCFTHLINVRWMLEKEYLARNKDIVNDCQILIATPKEFQHSIRSGTWTTIRYAWKKMRLDNNFKVIIIPPINRES